MEINYIDIGKRIKERRAKMSVTQEKLSELANLSFQHLSGIENGKTRFSVNSIINIANSLEMSLDELFCGSLAQGKVLLQNEFSELLADCTPEQAAVIIDTVKAMKKSMNENKSSGEA